MDIFTSEKKGICMNGFMKTIQEKKMAVCFFSLSITYLALSYLSIFFIPQSNCKAFRTLEYQGISDRWKLLTSFSKIQAYNTK